MSIEDQLRERIQRAAGEMSCPDDLYERVWKSNKRYIEAASSKRSRTVPDRRNFARRAVMACAAAVVLTAGVLASGFVSPAMAEALSRIPWVQNIFKFAGDMGLQNAAQQGLVNEVHFSDSHDDFTLTALQVVYDGTRASIALQLDKAGEPAALYSYLENGALKQLPKSQGYFKRLKARIDGAEAVTWDIGPGVDTSSAIITIIAVSDDQTRRAVLPEQFDLSLEVTLTGVREPFRFNIPICKNTRNLLLSPDAGKSFGNLSWKLQKLELSPISTRMSLLSEYKAADGRVLYFDLADDQGNIAGWIDVASERLPDGSRQFDLLYEPLPPDVKNVVIKPFLYVYEGPPANRVAKIDSQGRLIREYIKELEMTIPIF
ncbi:DUF4179 domain-containing protein [Paenibacillus macerans]|uniref:DUF4179 domain-containing protein n=1 Tax=Paenibacillus macerans TaxID=44252 RepID=UPI001B05E858|nr:DUF4179 domain-containing protein [Paenibacillus macerans]MEC0138786.1 DUF4179 domain-containing protein [Paenibacillus macerans]GIP10263.1 hypothetical protein J1TS5_24330 [Paenibacillus macerans]